MGPSIILDKSALQSLGQPSIQELGRYFYTILPPVLLYETLADLSLDPNDLEGSRAKVKTIAKKVFPTDAFANVDFRTACLYDLLTGQMEMARRAIVGGGKVIETTDGEKGIFLGASPEDDAVLRWMHGMFSEDDVQFAKQWRQSVHAIDLEKSMKDLEKPEFRMRSLSELSAGVGLILADLESQIPLLELFMSVLQLRDHYRNQIRRRWLSQRPDTIKSFAPYAFHCLRVHCLFYLGLSHHILGTRASNVVDVEYLCYSPFAHAFCSGDKLHQQLCPLILDADQEFVSRDDLRNALQAVAELREKASSRGSAATLAVEPDDGSLIRRLWNKHMGRPPAGRRPMGIPKEVSDAIMKKMQPIRDAIERAAKENAPAQRFPHPDSWKKQT